MAKETFEKLVNDSKLQTNVKLQIILTVTQILLVGLPHNRPHTSPLPETKQVARFYRLHFIIGLMFPSNRILYVIR